jgi:hypothetical protein
MEKDTRPLQNRATGAFGGAVLRTILHAGTLGLVSETRRVGAIRT